MSQAEGLLSSTELGKSGQGAQAKEENTLNTQHHVTYSCEEDIKQDNPSREPLFPYDCEEDVKQDLPSREAEPVVAETPESPKPATQRPRNLMVKGLAPDVSDDILTEWFEAYGVVLSAKVMLNINTGVSRCYGFVLYADECDAHVAMTALQGKEIGDTTLQIMRAITGSDEVVHKSPRILVRNIPLQKTSAELVDFFTQFGTVQSCIVRCDVGKSRGLLNFATVTFDSCDAATKAVDATHRHKVFDECEVPLLAKPADMEGSKKEKARKAAAAAGVPFQQDKGATKRNLAKKRTTKGHDGEDGFPQAMTPTHQPVPAPMMVHQQQATPMQPMQQQQQFAGMFFAPQPHMFQMQPFSVQPGPMYAPGPPGQMAMQNHMFGVAPQMQNAQPNNVVVTIPQSQPHSQPIGQPMFYVLPAPTHQ